MPRTSFVIYGKRTLHMWTFINRLFGIDVHGMLIWHTWGKREYPNMVDRLLILSVVDQYIVSSHRAARMVHSVRLEAE